MWLRCRVAAVVYKVEVAVAAVAGRAAGVDCSTSLHSAANSRPYGSEATVTESARQVLRDLSIVTLFRLCGVSQTPRLRPYYLVEGKLANRSSASAKSGFTCKARV